MLDNHVQKQFLDLSKGFSASLKAELIEKCDPQKPLKRLSFSYCKLGLASDQTIAEMAALIKNANAHTVGLNHNHLDKISASNFIILLDAFKNSHIKSIELNNNNLNSLIEKNGEAFVDFLRSTTATSIDLSSNSISDASSQILATNSEFINVNVSSNLLTKVGCRSFLSNSYLMSANFSANNIGLAIHQKISRKMRHNKNAPLEEKFIECVIAVAQGYKCRENNLYLLPKDILMDIFYLVGKGLRSEKNIQNVCRLIIDNIMASIPDKLVWNKKNSECEKDIFRKRTRFFKAHHVESISAPTRDERKPSSPTLQPL